MSVDGWCVAAALLVGGLAHLGVVQGTRSGRQQSAVSDAPQRWWTAVTRVWDNRAVLERIGTMAAALEATGL